jgi:hypothetical protein
VCLVHALVRYVRNLLLHSTAIYCSTVRNLLLPFTSDADAGVSGELPFRRAWGNISHDEFNKRVKYLITQGAISTETGAPAAPSAPVFVRLY